MSRRVARRPLASRLSRAVLVAALAVAGLTACSAPDPTLFSSRWYTAEGDLALEVAEIDRNPRTSDVRVRTGDEAGGTTRLLVESAFVAQLAAVRGFDYVIFFDERRDHLRTGDHRDGEYRIAFATVPDPDFLRFPYDVFTSPRRQLFPRDVVAEVPAWALPELVSLVGGFWEAALAGQQSVALQRVAPDDREVVGDWLRAGADGLLEVPGYARVQIVGLEVRGFPPVAGRVKLQLLPAEDDPRRDEEALPPWRQLTHLSFDGDRWWVAAGDASAE